MAAISGAATVVLRPMMAEDGERTFHWRTDPDVARWMYTAGPPDAAAHARWMAGALADPSRCYWIIVTDGQPVGLANLADIAPAHRRCAWAYYLADPSTRGRGVGSAVEFGVIEHVFGALGLEKLCCEVLIENEPVIALHEKFGFQREALYRRHVWKDGAPRDVVGLALLAEDWRSGARDAALGRLRDRGFAPAIVRG